MFIKKRVAKVQFIRLVEDGDKWRQRIVMSIGSEVEKRDPSWDLSGWSDAELQQLDDYLELAKLVKADKLAIKAIELLGQLTGEIDKNPDLAKREKVYNAMAAFYSAAKHFQPLMRENRPAAASPAAGNEKSPQ